MGAQAIAPVPGFTTGSFYTDGEFIYAEEHRAAWAKAKAADRHDNTGLIPLARVMQGNIGDAHFFAAAPGLYAAGEHLAKVADDKLATVKETVAAVLAMRAALSRARGEA